MKVLFLANASSIHTVRWVNALAQKGLKVHLAFIPNNRPKEHNILSEVVLHQLKISGTKGYFLNILELCRLIKEIKPDIVNAHYASGYGTLARLSKLKPLVLSVWGSDVYDFPYRSKIKHRLLERNLKYPDVIASTSVIMIKQVSTFLKNCKKDIEVTPFGVDIEKFAKIEKNKQQDDEIIVGSIKTLSPKYGIEYGIMAISFLVNEILKNSNDYKIKYYIYGDGSEKESLIKLVEDLNLNSVVEFKGRIPNNEVPDALNGFDIFLGTSVLDSESFGVAIVEAMSCEIPVIVTDVDGFKEVVDNGKSGIIVKRKDYKAMAQEIYKLIVNPEEREKLGERERTRVLDLYDWNKNVDNMVEIYNKTIKKYKENYHA